MRFVCTPYCSSWSTTEEQAVKERATLPRAAAAAAASSRRHRPSWSLFSHSRLRLSLTPAPSSYSLFSAIHSRLLPRSVSFSFSTLFSLCGLLRLAREVPINTTNFANSYAGSQSTKFMAEIYLWEIFFWPVKQAIELPLRI